MATTFALCIYFFPTLSPIFLVFPFLKLSLYIIRGMSARIMSFIVENMLGLCYKVGCILGNLGFSTSVLIISFLDDCHRWDQREIFNRNHVLCALLPHFTGYLIPFLSLHRGLLPASVGNYFCEL